MEVIFYEKRKDYKIMTKRFGFTLAEVLITLGIIGVVAAMTIPTLIANTNGAKFRSQFKKSISTLNQAGLMAQAQYDFDYAGTSSTCAAATGADGKTAVAPAEQHPDSVMSMCAILNGTLTGQTYLGAVSTIKRNNNGSSLAYSIVNKGKGVIPDAYTGYLAYALADGSIVAFDPNAQACELPIGTQLTAKVLAKANPAGADDAAKKGGALGNCMGFIDVNGATLPNKEVTCSDKGSGATAAGSASLNVDKPCTVKNDAAHMTDIFPIVFHDATVEPASDAAKYILTTSK